MINILTGRKLKDAATSAALSLTVITSLIGPGLSVMPKVAVAATNVTIFSDGFGTGTTDSSFNESPAWTEGGDGAEKRAIGSGNDTVSPNGGRFAVMFGEDGYICATVNATGYDDIELSYYWRGDSDAESSDDGKVEYKADSGSCSGSGWANLKTHNLDSSLSSWTTQSSFGLPSNVDNSTFRLRFRTDSNDGSGSDAEHFRVDGVVVTGDESVGTLIVKKVVVNDNEGTAATSSFSFKVNGGTAVPFEADGSNNLSLAAGTYTITEPATSGYAASYDGCTSVVLGAGQTKTCTITNNDIPTKATIVATKIVCTDENDLPNWGAGAGGPDITVSTAADFLETHEDCRAESGWSFEWGTENAGNPGDALIGAAGSPWTTFGPTNGSGVATTNVLIDSTTNGKIWMREVLKAGYLAFAGETNPVSAEMYCSEDVLKFDNYDRIDEPEAGNTYYCVAFNVPTQGTLRVIKEVINDNGNDKTPSYFTLHVKNGDDDVAGSPAAGSSEGTDYLLTAGSYSVSEDPDANYTVSYSGDCDSSGAVNVVAEQTKTCTVTNDDVPQEEEPTDTDGDGIPDDEDNCPTIANEGQEDENDNGIGDVCEEEGPTDTDEDGIPDEEDNCINTPNEDQADEDENGVGDVCEEETSEDQSCVYVSDTSNTVEGEESLNAVASFVHSAWTASIPGATWIWKTFLPSNPSVNETESFVKEFNVTGPVSSVILNVASDNSYKVFLNGTERFADAAEVNFSAGGQDTHDLTEYVEEGNNTLKIEVMNIGISGSEPENNPAGLLYKLTVNSAACGEPEQPADVCPNLDGNQAEVPAGYHVEEGEEGNVCVADSMTISGNKWEDTDGDGVWDEEENGKEGWTIALGLVGETQQGEGGSTIPVEIVALTLTGERGDYSFPVTEPGHYMILEETKDGWIVTNPEANESDSFFDIFTELSLDAPMPPLEPDSFFDVFIEAISDGGDISYDNNENRLNFGNHPSPEDTQALCSDGLDNDGDEDVDLHDRDCLPWIPNTPPIDGNGLPQGNGGGEVLGASTTDEAFAPSSTCADEAPYIGSYIKFGADNNSDDVKKLQMFLNETMGTTLAITGVYDEITRDVLMAYQLLHWREILLPWVPFGLPSAFTPTGYVYKTTLWWINETKCQERTDPMPLLP